MKKSIIFLILLFPVLIFGQGQRLGVNPKSIKLTKQKSKDFATSFCSDGYARNIPSATKDTYKYFQSTENIEAKVDGKFFEGGIDKLIHDKHISINTVGDEQVFFNLNPISKYNSVSINIKEPNVLSDKENDFEIEGIWLEKLYKLKILPENIKSFKQANSYLKEFQEQNNLLETDGLLTEDTRELLDGYARLGDELTETGYLEADYKSYKDILVAAKSYSHDWGNLESFNTWKEIAETNKTDISAFKTYIITKAECGEYVVFDDIQKPVFRGTDEIELAKFISSSNMQCENIYLYLNNFITKEKQEAFLSTLRIDAVSKSKKINYNLLPSTENNLLFEKIPALRLSKSISNDDIKSIKYNNKDFFTTSMEFNIKDSPNESNEIEALAIRRSILEELITKTRSIFKDATTKISLFRFFNSFKKELKQTLKIENDDEFILHIKSEFQDIRIVKFTGDNNIYFASN